MGDWVKATASGVRVAIYAQPRASRTEVVGIHGDALKVKVASPPVDGAANDELTRFLAKRLGVAGSRVSIASGASGRRKVVDVEGVSEAQARSALLDSQ